MIRILLLFKQSHNLLHLLSKLVVCKKFQGSSFCAEQGNIVNVTLATIFVLIHSLLAPDKCSEISEQ